MEIIAFNFFDKKFEEKILDEIRYFTKRKRFLLLYDFKIFLKNFRKISFVEKKKGIKILRGFYSYEGNLDKISRYKWYINLYISTSPKNLVNNSIRVISDIILPLSYCHYSFYHNLREKRISMLFPINFFFNSVKENNYKISRILIDNLKIAKHYNINLIFSQFHLFKSKRDRLILLQKEEVKSIIEFFGYNFKELKKFYRFYYEELYDRVYKMFKKKYLIYPGIELIFKQENETTNNSEEKV